MKEKDGGKRVRVLPEDLVNKIAAGEVVERPASVVKELVENALDAGATRIVVRLVAAGRRTIEVVDNGHGMSEQDALLAIERHTTSKVRKSEDLDHITTLGFRGEALASIAAVSRFELATRRKQDESACRIRIDGGILKDVSQAAAPAGTRVTVNRLYFNTPVRAKFLKGITTELSHAIDIVQRYSLSEIGVGFQLSHNDKVLLDVPENAGLRERIALIWGLGFANDTVELRAERAGYRIHGFIGTPNLTRAQRSHQFFFLNRRPVVNRAIQYGFEDAYRGLLTVGRHPVGVLLIETHPRFVDVNIHPTKREVRFRDERAARDAVRESARERLAALSRTERAPEAKAAGKFEPPARDVEEAASPEPVGAGGRGEPPSAQTTAPQTPQAQRAETPTQTEIPGARRTPLDESAPPEAVFQRIGNVAAAPMQVFDAYLLVPEEDRLLIIDQHALHERLMYDSLRAELDDSDYAAQQLAVPVLVDVPPSHANLLESNRHVFARLGIELEPFGDTTFQVTAVCHLYEESKIADAIYRVLDELAQGDLFDKENFVADLLRVTVQACRGAVKAGDRLSPEERQGLIEGFRRLRAPYTCPHGRPIITELTQRQMEKSFRRRP